jgi:hypothetical protein
LTGYGKTGGQHHAHERLGCQEGHGEAGLQTAKVISLNSFGSRDDATPSLG